MTNKQAAVLITLGFGILILLSYLVWRDYTEDGRRATVLIEQFDSFEQAQQENMQNAIYEELFIE